MKQPQGGRWIAHGENEAIARIEMERSPVQRRATASVCEIARMDRATVATLAEMRKTAARADFQRLFGA